MRKVPLKVADYEACRAAVEKNQRLQTVAHAAKEFFSLPNWENRLGGWRDINDGLLRLAAAVRAAGLLE